ncbi:MAG: hypothetical protein IKV94_03170 [Clostridia bacterium]|nr:hypothetical protein [Clostridia bacterium]
MKSDFFERAAKIAEQAADFACEKFDAAKEATSKRLEEIKIKSSLHEALEMKDTLFAEYGKLVYLGNFDEEHKSEIEEMIEENSACIAELEEKLELLYPEEECSTCECDCEKQTEGEEHFVFCSKCGRKFETSENFCSSCGAILHKD